MLCSPTAEDARHTLTDERTPRRAHGRVARHALYSHRRRAKLTDDSPLARMLWRCAPRPHQQLPIHTDAAPCPPWCAKLTDDSACIDMGLTEEGGELLRPCALGCALTDDGGVAARPPPTTLTEAAQSDADSVMTLLVTHRRCLALTDVAHLRLAYRGRPMLLFVHRRCCVFSSLTDAARPTSSMLLLAHRHCCSLAHPLTWLRLQ